MKIIMDVDIEQILPQIKGLGLVPISVIEDIEKEIRRRCDNEIGDSIYNYSMRCSDVIAIIDQCIEKYKSRL